MIKEKNIIFGVFLSILLIILYYRVDLIFSPDSKTFFNTAKNIDTFYSIFSQPQPLYTTSYLIFKFLSLFGDFNLNYKIFNFLCFFFIVFFSQRIIEHFRIKLESRTTYIYFYLLFFLNFEIIQWTYYALTDLVLIALMLAIIYFFLKNKNLICFILIFFSLFIKPQSIFIIFIISFLYSQKMGFSAIKFLFAYLLFLIMVVFISHILNKYGIKIHIFNITYKIFLEKLFQGIVIDDKIIVEYNNVFSILKIYFLRLINVFSIFFHDYSIKHKVYKVLYFILLYSPILFFILKIRIFEKKIITFIFCNFLIVLIFLVLTFIDFDLRYRLYFYPFLIMLSTYCLNKIHEKKRQNIFR